MIIEVKSRRGHLEIEEPASFTEGKLEYQVEEIVDRWIGMDHSYFKVVDGDGCTHMLRHDLIALVWETIDMQAPQLSTNARRPAWRRA